MKVHLAVALPYVYTRCRRLIRDPKLRTFDQAEVTCLKCRKTFEARRAQERK